MVRAAEQVGQIGDIGRNTPQEQMLPVSFCGCGVPASRSCEAAC
jgi:hypothetical protein